MAQDGNAARTIESLPPPVEGPAVWYGPDMAKRTEWVHALSADDLGEIELAMRPLAECASRHRPHHQGRFPAAETGAEARADL